MTEKAWAVVVLFLTVPFFLAMFLDNDPGEGFWMHITRCYMLIWLLAALAGGVTVMVWGAAWALGVLLA